MDCFRRWRAFLLLRGKNSALAVGFFLELLLQSSSRPFATFFQNFQFDIPQ